jgi:hypothetical protein
VRFGSIVFETAPRARTLFELAWAMPFGEALAGPWLFCSARELVLKFVVPVVLVVGGIVVVRFSTLLGLAFIMPLGDALTPPPPPPP